ncbi:MAG: hypothetical protein ABI665_03870 [Vicinamibacterales bacterium]
MTAAAFVTPAKWPHQLVQYGAPETYRLAAAWLKDCQTIADWGGAAGFFGSFLEHGRDYTVVDGTEQADVFAPRVLANLTEYRAPSDGILLRHVLDNTPDWQPILANALAAFRRRMVIVTFTPDAPVTRRIDRKNGWPIWTFNPDDLRRAIGPCLVRDEAVPTTHPERVYYLEKPCA